jgi:PAS domain S-box-containing protein
MFEFTPVAMAELGVDGTIMRANAAAGLLFGCPPEELIGHRTPDLGDPQEKEDNTRNLARFASGDLLSNVSERRLRDLHGRQRWVSVYTAAVAGTDGRVDRLVMQVIDITEARELRERLQRSVDELSVAYREKAALMTALSHDLRTPLATIRILAELLVVGDSTVEGGAGDLARRLLAESARTEGVLGDLFRSERASEGSITPRRVSISLNELVRRVVHVEADQRSSHEIILHLADEECTVVVDPALVERMIANLIANAIRHTSTGSKVWVSVAIDPTTDDGAVQLVVADNGEGVPDVLKEAIFEPYVHRTSADQPGSGIGLFLVRRFAEFHGGTVVCEDREGGGASFRVTLPRE